MTTPVYRVVLRRGVRWCGMVLATFAVACGACSEEPPSNPAGDAVAVAEPVELPPLPDAVPMPGAIYDRAYQRALEELDADSARERLREIEREVARERRELE